MAPAPQETGLKVDIAQAGARTVVSVSGELDIATVAAFDAAVREQLARGPVLLDLRALSFMDSSGVRALGALVRGDGTLAVAADLHPNVRQVLELTGVISLLPLE
ncbi:MAG TPA: STAS domain-containing protein, partial [Solirubrobacteraceae bacterium]